MPESVWLFWFWLKEQAEGTSGKGKVLVLLFTCVPFIRFWRWGPVVGTCPRDSFPGNKDAMTSKCVTLDPLSYEPCAHISQDPFPESLLVCPVTPSCEGCLSGVHLNEDAGTGPFYRVSPGRGTQQPWACLLRRSRRPGCRSCSGLPGGLEESIGTVSDLTTTTHPVLTWALAQSEICSISKPDLPSYYFINSLRQGLTRSPNCPEILYVVNLTSDSQPWSYGEPVTLVQSRTCVCKSKPPTGPSVILPCLRLEGNLGR